EAPFLSHARQIASHGHAMVVMLFDEEGQAATYERKIAIAKRSHELLVGEGIREEDIIFDANVLAIATGIEEHDTYARDFILATRELKRLYPRCSTSGGVSNLSFSFRGNDELRTAMHAAFLNLASLDMAIINPSSLLEVHGLDPQVRSTIEHALLADTDDLNQVRANLIALAMGMQKEEKSAKKVVRSTDDPKKNLYDAVLGGEHTFLQEDLELLKEEDPLLLVEGPLMDGMKEVGRLFGEGKLFLPQVVRSARTMKMAVDLLQPRITAWLAQQTASGSQAKKVAVMATVKGDVHDIGKNIVNLLLRCNNYEVIDLGVMVQPEAILEAARAHNADLVGLSGLITPSLKEMETVIRLFEEHQSTIPIFVGGATTSALHTAVKLSPLYSEAVIQTKDASSMVLAANEVMGKQRAFFLAGQRALYESLRLQHSEKKGDAKTSGSYLHALSLGKQKERGSKAGSYGVYTASSFSLPSLIGHINWKMYCAAWKVPFDSDEGRRLVGEAKILLAGDEVRTMFEEGCKVVYGLFPASSDRMAVTVGDHRFHFLRNEENGLCLADCIAKEDTVGLFVTTSALTLPAFLETRDVERDGMEVLSLKLLADRLAEALAEEAERLIRSTWAHDHAMYLRPAPGYPSWNDHSEKGVLFAALGATERIGVRLTESYAMDPPSSVCGMLIGGDDLRYFALKGVSEEQLDLYAERKGLSREALATLLSGMGY
ncbi:MAG: vitamin B12 dependent-methionine synthase activation domain-containing protein, partial [Sphaerochaeta sp.]|nr:vitamin B12 dependent-methionine synthase activation domain-containing protein [Sphaerochaeta sp.]